ncbi:MAG: uracil-DNA glycosylase [Treponema sp.]|nr:uracil-DNA glycosylase [Treponema sp.]
MTAEQKTKVALFLDMAGDYLRDGYKRPPREYAFAADLPAVSPLCSDTTPSDAVVITTPRIPASGEPGTTPGKEPGVEGADSLEMVAAAVRCCTGCPLHTTRTMAVPGEGVSHPLVLVIGEGPGADEDASGRPFVGKAGQLLDKMLAAIGLSREQHCFIANVVKCRPPGNRDPLPEEVASCASFLTRQIRLLKPLVILGAGRVSTQTLLNTSEGIGKLRGGFTPYAGIPLLPTYHPSALLRDASLKRPAWEDLKLLRTKLIDLDETYALNTPEGS